MGLSIYKRGKFWWLTGNLAGKRIHQSTGQSVEENADKIRVLRESEILGLLEAGSQGQTTFSVAVRAYCAAGNAMSLPPELQEFFGGIKIRDLPYIVRATAKLLFPDEDITIWNEKIVSPVMEIVKFAEEAGLGPAINLEKFSWREGEAYKRERRTRPASSAQKEV